MLRQQQQQQNRHNDGGRQSVAKQGKSVGELLPLRIAFICMPTGQSLVVR
jgi:hypothetical protein